MKILKTTICILFIFLLVSCESKEMKHEQLVGNWKIVKASRDGEETRTLEQGYFNFGPNKVFSNVVSTSDSIPYKFEDQRIKIANDVNMEFVVTEFKNDSLYLSGLINTLKFDLVLIK